MSITYLYIRINEFFSIKKNLQYYILNEIDIINGVEDSIISHTKFNITTLKKIFTQNKINETELALFDFKSFYCLIRLYFLKEHNI